MHRFFIFKTVSTFLFPGVSEYFGCYLSIDKRLAEHLAFIVSVFILTGCFFSTISILGPDQSCSSPVFGSHIFLCVRMASSSSCGNWRKSNEE